MAPPEELSRPIIKAAVPEFRAEPTSAIHPRIDGKVSSYFEWLGAGVYRLDGRSGSMHGKRSPVSEVHFGVNRERLFLRIDFHDAKETTLDGVEVRLRVEGSPKEASGSLGVFDPTPGASFAIGGDFPGAECAFQHIFEASVPLALFGNGRGESPSGSSSLCGKMACRWMRSPSKAGSRRRLAKRNDSDYPLDALGRGFAKPAEPGGFDSGSSRRYSFNLRYNVVRPMPRSWAAVVWSPLV